MLRPSVKASSAPSRSPPSPGVPATTARMSISSTARSAGGDVADPHSVACHGLTPPVRVPSIDHAVIGRVLDGGAQGVVAPISRRRNRPRMWLRPAGRRGLFPDRHPHGSRLAGEMRETPRMVPSGARPSGPADPLHNRIADRNRSPGLHARSGPGDAFASLTAGIVRARPQIASATARPTSPVPAPPPMSGVRGPSVRTVSTALTMSSWAAR